MRYQFTYSTTGFELWQLAMYGIYGSMAGVCNMIFTAAMAALIVSRWNTASTIMQLLMVFGLILFPLIQPCMIYLRARKQASRVEQDTTICFEDRGIHVIQGTQNSDIKWKAIKKISKKPTLIILFSDTAHGFVLTNRVLGAEKEAFYTYITSKIEAC